MSKIDEFKSFVKTKPSLINYVRNGDMTWQKFYDLWYLYGENHEEWNKYNNISTNVESFTLGTIFNAFKNIDIENVRQNVAGIQKVIGLIQDMTNKDDKKTEPYKPRPVYRRFED